MVNNFWSYIIGSVRPMAAALLVLSNSYPATAEATGTQRLELSGHDVVIRSAHKIAGEMILDTDTLLIDKKVLLKDRQVYINASGSFGDTGFAVGMHTSGGMCDNTYFVLVFPAGGPPRISGKIHTCFLRFGVEKDSIIFETVDNPEGDDPNLRSRWIWTTGGLGLEQHFKIGTGAVGGLLRSRSIRQPADLLEHAEFTEQVEQLAKTSGVSENALFETIKGTGTVHYDGNVMVGRACQADTCTQGSLLVAVDIPSKKLYLALKSGDKPAIISPKQTAWPPSVQDELGQWKSQWEPK